PGEAAVGNLALEPSQLAGQLVAVLLGKGGEEGVPRLRQRGDGTSLLHRRARDEAGRGRQRWERGDRRRRRRYRVQLPHRARGRARLEQRGPGVGLLAAEREQVEVVR